MMTQDEDVFAMSSFSLLIQKEEQEEDILLDLHTASLIGDFDAVRNFITSKVDLDKQNFGGWTPLMYAAYVGRDNILNMLLEAGVKTEVVTKKDGLTALMLASYSATESIMYFLLQAGANINARDNNGYTSLFHAVRQGHKSAVTLLASNGANLNLGHYHTGMTPLMEAAAGGHDIIFSILIEHGADLTLQSKQGDARSVAIHYGYPVIVELIDKASHNQPTGLREEPCLTNESNISDGPAAVRSLVMDRAAASVMNTQQAPVAALCPNFTRLTTNTSAGFDRYNPAPTAKSACLQMSGVTQTQPGVKGPAIVHFNEERLPKKNSRMGNEPPKQVFFQRQALPETLPELLEQYKLESHLSLFDSQGIDVNTFLALTDNDLRELGIDKLGRRKKILIAINKVKQEMGANSTTTEQHPVQFQTQIQDLTMRLHQSFAYIKQLQNQLQSEQHYRTEFNNYLETEQQRMRQIVFYTNDIGKNCKETCAQVRKIKEFNEKISAVLQRVKNHSNYGSISSELSINVDLFESANSTKCEIDMVINRLDMTYKQIERTLVVAQMPAPNVSA